MTKTFMMITLQDDGTFTGGYIEFEAKNALDFINENEEYFHSEAYGLYGEKRHVKALLEQTHYDNKPNNFMFNYLDWFKFTNRKEVDTQFTAIC